MFSDESVRPGQRTGGGIEELSGVLNGKEKHSVHIYGSALL